MTKTIALIVIGIVLLTFTQFVGGPLEKALTVILSMTVGFLVGHLAYCDLLLIPLAKSAKKLHDSIAELKSLAENEEV